MFILNLAENINEEDNLIYGFPKILEDFSVKIATENFTIDTEQSDLNRIVEQKEVDAFFAQYISGNCSDMLSNECTKSAVCSYTATLDRKFILDFASESKNVLFVSACSGHGFKHSAAIGELAIYNLLQRPTIIDPSIFSVNRFAKNEDFL